MEMVVGTAGGRITLLIAQTDGDTRITEDMDEEVAPMPIFWDCWRQLLALRRQSARLLEATPRLRLVKFSLIL